MTRDALSAIAGNYEDKPGTKAGKNDWHYVTVSRIDATTLKWTNRAGVTWTLKKTANATKFNVGVDCPYYKDGYTTAQIYTSGTKITGIQGPGNGTYTRVINFTETKYGLEKINFRVPAVLNSEHFNLVDSSGTSYNKTYSCWQINAKSGYFDFEYDQDAPRDISLTLTLCSSSVKGVTDCPITITWNGKTVEADFDPHNTGFYNKSWRIQSAWTKAGTNKLRIQLGSKAATKVFIWEAMVGNFVIQPQQQTMWCWDAVGVSVADYAKRYANDWVQCTMYDAVNATNGACKPAFRSLPKGPPLNSGGWPKNSLAKAGVLNSHSGTVATWDEVLGQARTALLIACTVWWRPYPKGGGHVVVMSNPYSVVDKNKKTTNHVVIDDPWYGRSTYVFDEFQKNYRQAGYWDQTCFTKNPAA